MTTRRAWNSTCPLPSKPLVRGKPPKRSTKPIKKRGAAKLKREKRYAAYIKSAAWKKLRKAVFARDGWRCTNVVTIRRVLTYQGEEVEFGVFDERCPYTDATEMGVGLVCDHKTYARFEHENLEDLQTLCITCNALLTKQTRANWAGR